MILKITPAAMQDLRDIQEYISDTLNSPVAAKGTISKIIKSYKLLSDAPFIGASLNSKIDVETSYRYLVSGNYLIFYKIFDDFVEISRIIYGKRDYIKVLFKSEINYTSEDEN